jgi:tetratricopeptide (TPR) repeat protein
MLLKAEAFAPAYDAFARAVSLNSRNAGALAGLSDAAAGARRVADERQLLTSIVSREPGNDAARIELSRVLAAAGEYEAAIAAVRPAITAQDGGVIDPRPFEQAASVMADAGDIDRLKPAADFLSERFPGRPDALYYKATALFMRGQADEAAALAKRVTEAQPTHARAQNLLGAACATLGRRECAQAAFEASLRANPRDASTYVNAATFALQTANPQAAASYFAEALAIDPQSEAARSGLAQARAQLAR